MGARRRGRITAFQALYAWDTADDKEAALKDLFDFSWVEDQNLENVDFSRLLIAGTLENIGTIDTMITKHLNNWDFSRLNKTDKALLRLSAYELLFNTTPPMVVIDEAVDISKEYGTDDSYRFINGVLDGIYKTIQGSANAGLCGKSSRKGEIP